MINKIFGFLAPSKLINAVKGVKGFLAGKKTYLAGAIVLLESLSMLVEQFLGMEGVADIVDAAKNFATNDGLLRMAEAFAIFGIRAALPFNKKS
ncbi:hypothetical protein AAIR98_001598 [Elusimicrobium simillimum]|uniref:hypothetical protein n=1 Tax=Elusimicrobium simillimum TaxID=3143438 RepID=UPI003C6F5AA1